jgi:hypothetical protein
MNHRKFEGHETRRGSRTPTWTEIQNTDRCHMQPKVRIGTKPGIIYITMAFIIRTQTEVAVYDLTEFSSQNRL